MKKLSIDFLYRNLDLEMFYNQPSYWLWFFLGILLLFCRDRIITGVVLFFDLEKAVLLQRTPEKAVLLQKQKENVADIFLLRLKHEQIVVQNRFSDF